MFEITLPGVVVGKTIELETPQELFDGNRVEVTVRISVRTKKSVDGLLRCSGGMAPFWTDEDDRILAEIQKDRKRTSLRDQHLQDLLE